MVAGPLFEFGIGNSDEVNMNWVITTMKKSRISKAYNVFKE